MFPPRDISSDKKTREPGKHAARIKPREGIPSRVVLASLPTLLFVEYNELKEKRNSKIIIHDQDKSKTYVQKLSSLGNVTRVYTKF